MDTISAKIQTPSLIGPAGSPNTEITDTGGSPALLPEAVDTFNQGESNHLAESERMKAEMKRIDEAIRGCRATISMQVDSLTDYMQYSRNYCRQSLTTLGVGAAVAAGSMIMNVTGAIPTLACIAAGLGAVAFCGTKISATLKEKRITKEIDQLNERVTQLQMERISCKSQSDVEALAAGLSGETQGEIGEEEEFVVIDGLKLSKKSEKYLPSSFKEILRKSGSYS